MEGSPPGGLEAQGSPAGTAGGMGSARQGWGGGDSPQPVRPFLGTSLSAEKETVGGLGSQKHLLKGDSFLDIKHI